MTDQEIKDLKDGVPNYPMPEIKRQEYPHEWLCGECTGSGVMLGFYPCKVCGGKGYIVPESKGFFISTADDNKGEDNHSSMWKKHFEAYRDGEQDKENYIKQMGLYQASITESWQKYSFTDLRRMLTNASYPNERELALLNNRIATLKAQLSKELQKKKSERSQRDINQLQKSINTLTKWKTQKKS